MKNSDHYGNDNYHQKSPDRFEQHFEDESNNNSEFSERKKHIQFEDHVQNQGKSHFSPETNKTDKFPVQIIKYNPKKNTFEFNELAEEILSKYDQNIGFVSLAGKYRTGKSFLLNRLLDLSGDGFRVDPSIEACTEGIWMWSEPIYIPEKKMHLFFLDTEGTESTNREKNHDAKIFALAILMSSLFMFNSIGSIDEKSISQLSLTTKLSENIALSGNKKNSEHDEAQLAKFTPKFIWILRDFTLELQDSYQKNINPTQYLENALRDQSTISKSNEQNRKIRSALLNFFKNRDCVTMVRPVIEENDLQRLNSLPNHRLRKEFLLQLKGLKEKVLYETAPKQLNGVNLNARMFCGMMKNFLDSINKGGVPNITSAWEFIVENECVNSYNAALDLYNEKMKIFYANVQPKNYPEISVYLRSIRDEFMDKFHSAWNSKEKNAVFIEYKKKMKAVVDEKEQRAFQWNEEICETENKKILNVTSEELISNVKTNYYSGENLDGFFSDLQQFLNEYDNKTLGAKKTIILVDFLQNLLTETVHAFLHMNKNEDFDMMNNEAISKEKEADFKTHIKSLEAKNAIFHERVIKIEKEIAESEHQIEDPEKRKLEAMKIEIEALKEGSKKKNYDLQQKSNSVHNLEKELDDLQHELKKLNKSSWGCCGTSKPKAQQNQSNVQRSANNQRPPNGNNSQRPVSGNVQRPVSGGSNVQRPVSSGSGVQKPQGQRPPSNYY